MNGISLFVESRRSAPITCPSAAGVKSAAILEEFVSRKRKRRWAAMAKDHRSPDRPTVACGFLANKIVAILEIFPLQLRGGSAIQEDHAIPHSPKIRPVRRPDETHRHRPNRCPAGPCRRDILRDRGELPALRGAAGGGAAFGRKRDLPLASVALLSADSAECLSRRRWMACRAIRCARGRGQHLCDRPRGVGRPRAAADGAGPIRSPMGGRSRSLAPARPA